MSPNTIVLILGALKKVPLIAGNSQVLILQGDSGLTRQLAIAGPLIFLHHAIWGIYRRKTQRKVGETPRSSIVSDPRSIRTLYVSVI